jgi:predicted hotdog family 3-hydroxylacyl-ACP dehydratase
MRLVDRLLAADHREALTEATPTEHWPLRQANAVSSLVAVEISAQTAGILVGIQERRIKGASLQGKGWLVGIKKAAFHRDGFRIGRTIQTHAKLVFSYQTFHEIDTEVRVGDIPAADITLQLFWIETGSGQPFPA